MFAEEFELGIDWNALVSTPILHSTIQYVVENSFVVSVLRVLEKFRISSTTSFFIMIDKSVILRILVIQIHLDQPRRKILQPIHSRVVVDHLRSQLARRFPRPAAMEQMLQHLLQAAKDKGKGKGKSKNKGNATKRQRTQNNPMQKLTRLAVTTAKLALSNGRSKRQIIADLTHTAMNTMPVPPELKDALDVTQATKGTERRSAAKATLLALCKGLSESKRVATGSSSGHKVVKYFYHGNTSHLDEKVVECRVVITYGETMVKTTWWLKNLVQLDEAIQDILVFLGADVRHGAAPMYGEERDVLDALTDVVGGASSSTAQYSDP